MNNADALREVAWLFLRLGATAFGGPAAHIALMRREVVEERKWMTEERFLDLVGATNLIPGPNSTEMAIHIGYDRAGRWGLVFAGLCFIFPAVLITGLCAWFYKTYGQLPQIQPYFYGVKPAIIAVVSGAIYPLARASLRSSALAVAGVAALVLSLAGVSELLILFGTGGVFLVFGWLKQRQAMGRIHLLLPIAFQQGFNEHLTGNVALFWIFLKIGAILYGSGYVLFAFLDAELVVTGLLTRRELLDAIAVGQFTPGPVFSAVTFVGWQIHGLGGAVAATIGIFLPSFVFVALLRPIVKTLRNSPVMSAFLDAVNVASVGLILAVCITMAREVLTDWQAILIALAAFVVVFRFKNINSAWIIAGGAIAGALLQ